MKTRDTKRIYIGIELFTLPTKEGDFILKNPDLFYSYDPPQSGEGKRFLLLWDVDCSPKEIQAQTQLYYYTMCDNLFCNLPPKCHPWTNPILRFVCIVPSDLSDRKPYDKAWSHPFFRWDAASVIFSACSTLGDGIKCVTHEDFEEHFRGQNLQQEKSQWILTEKGYKKALKRFENRAMTLLTSINSMQTYALFMPHFEYVMACSENEVSHHVPLEIGDRAWRRSELVRVGLHFRQWFKDSAERQKLYPAGLMLIRRRKRYCLYDYEENRRLRYNKELNIVEESGDVSAALSYDAVSHIHLLPKGDTFPEYLLRKGKRMRIGFNTDCPII